MMMERGVWLPSVCLLMYFTCIFYEVVLCVQATMYEYEGCGNVMDEQRAG